MNKNNVWAGMFLSVAIAGGAMAGKPIQISLTPDIALFNRNKKINGLRWRF